jgi:two-component system, response regulator
MAELTPRGGPILLVEDNPDDVALTLRALRKNHIRNEVIVARDGVEALALLFGDAGEPPMPTLPVLVLLDLNLPRINGFEVLRRIRGDERMRLLRVIVLTSSREERDIAGSYSLGATSYVQKPVDFERFLEAVGQMGMYWLLLNEPPPAAAE